MKALTRSRIALSLSAAALLAACGGSQPPIGTPGAMLQSSTFATHSERGRSWMLPEAKGSSLIYESNDAGVVFVLSYPKGELVGELTGFQAAVGECVDNQGDVWITDQELSEIVEFAHAGTTPIATLSWPGAELTSCSINPANGDLAVANHFPAEVAVYPNAQGTPTVYSSSDYTGFYYCSYDNNGDLYLSGYDAVYGPLAELPVGSSQINPITVDQHMDPASIQWDGAYLAVADLLNDKRGKNGPTTVYRLAISGSTGTVVSSLKLVGPYHMHDPTPVQYWIAGNRILGPSMRKHAPNSLLSIWSYPSGGKPLKTLTPNGAHGLVGTALSTAEHK